MDYVPQSSEGAETQGFEQMPIDNPHLILKAPLPANHGLVLIVEDIHPSVLEILGKPLDIDLNFVDHVVTKYADIKISPAPPSGALTSSQTVSQADILNIHFQKMADLGAEENFRNSSWTLQPLTNVPCSVRGLVLVFGRQIALNRIVIRVCQDYFVRDGSVSIRPLFWSSKSPRFLPLNPIVTIIRLDSRRLDSGQCFV